MDNKKNNEINVSDLFSILKMKWLKILIGGVIAALIAFGYSNFFVVPQYRAAAQMFVDTRRESSEGKDTYIQSSHISAAKELAEAYTKLIKTNTILNQVVSELNLNMSYSSLAKKISISVVDDTQILQVYVTDTDRERALKIVTKIVEISPITINAKIDSGKLISIDDPTVTTNPVSPNVLKDTVLGLFAGLFVVYAYFIVRRLLDNKFKSAEDLQRMLDLPVLGVIPSLEHITSK